MTTRSISRIVKDRLIEAGFDSDRLTAHSLRHTAATLNLLNGGTVEETKQLLRHSNINTTLIYSHALERAKNDSENRIARAIFK
jgi:integrase/recombinase XerC